MFSHIMVPVDLSHAAAMAPAVKAASDLAHANDARITYVGVTTAEPSSVARTPEEFGRKLAAFAEEHGDGLSVDSRAITSHDPTSDLDRKLLDAAKEMGADLVVMVTHHPNLADRIWSGHGGDIAAHADMSVLLLRS
ncbi:universal stress protein [Mesobaculum littorinae]|uniref:Universal stress protein n=1 Tax=Mesobaculum littorinae TaxID=2486419 RepID=A0A438AKH4_9RHOB|nr:universal stress protein [Mesobaculum littorinae]